MNEQQLTTTTNQSNQSVTIFEPKNLGEGMELAKLMAGSDMVPTAYKGKPGNIIIAMQMGYEVGLKPMQALQNITVINGRPCIWGDALLALVQGSGKLKYIKEWEEEDVSYCETLRDGYPDPYRNSFSDADAKAAGLLNKQGPWQTNKRRMRQMRARAFNLRDQFADVLKGLSSAEEVQDYPVNVTPREQAPQRTPTFQTPRKKTEVLGKDLSIESAVNPPVVTELINASTGEVIDDPFMASVKSVQLSNKQAADTISEPQQKRLFAISKQNHVSSDALKEHLKACGYNSSKEILKSDYEKICDWVLECGSNFEFETGSKLERNLDEVSE